MIRHQRNLKFKSPDGWVCDGCREVTHQPYPVFRRHGLDFCMRICYDLYRERLIRELPGRNEISKCHQKEAKAMLQGLNTTGKNKCVKLNGDL
jgi:hypothetical protein